jgi:hypothetical protein
MKDTSIWIAGVLLVVVLFIELMMLSQPRNLALELVFLALIVAVVAFELYAPIADLINDFVSNRKLQQELALLPAFYKDLPSIYLGRDTIYKQLAKNLELHPVSPEGARLAVLLSAATVWENRQFLRHNPDAPAFDPREVASEAEATAALVSKLENKGTLTPKQIAEIKETVAKLKIEQ